MIYIIDRPRTQDKPCFSCKLSRIEQDKHITNDESEKETKDG